MRRKITMDDSKIYDLTLRAIQRKNWKYEDVVKYLDKKKVAYADDWETNYYNIYFSDGTGFLFDRETGNYLP